MLDKILNSINKFPDRNAFFIKDKYYTYSQIGQLISNIKDSLNKDNVGEGKLVGVTTYDNIETYASILGILFSGYGFVPINPEYPIERNLSIIDQSGVNVILTSKFDENVEAILQLKKATVINSSDLNNSNNKLTLQPADDNEIAYLLFTSGSTGIPKGVPISRANLYSYLDAFYALGYGITPDDRCLQMFDLTFDLSVTSYLTPLCEGACVYTVPPGGIKYTYVYSLLEDQHITHALMVPSIITYLKPFFNEINLPDFRWSLFCGEALYDDIVREWANCIPNAKIQNVYGPTEATIYCLVYDWKREEKFRKDYNGIVCIGKPMKNMDAIIVDEYLNEVTPGEKGELCLSGGQLTPGYWKNPDNNRNAFFKTIRKGKEEIFYKTGDIAFMDEDGDFMFVGRIDHQVKVHGFRVELSEIEFYAREFVKNINVAAIAAKNVSGTMLIHLFLENYHGTIQDVENYLKNKLPLYMVPSSISNHENFPLNVNGKIDRKALLISLSNPENILERIRYSFKKYPQNTAFHIGGRNYTYKDFAVTTSNIRNYLETNCDFNEKLLGVFVSEESDFETYCALFGILYAGYGYVPINCGNPFSRNKDIIEQAKIKTILTSNITPCIKQYEELHQISLINIHTLSEAKINLNSPSVSNNEIAYLLFTSGSTGVPKGVPITRGNLDSFIDAVLNFNLDVNENDRFLQMFELTFDFSVFCYIFPLCIGASVYPLPSEGVKFANVYNIIEEHEITFASMVPSVLSFLRPYFEELRFEKMKYSLFCGEALLNDLTEEWAKCIPNGKVINTYGPTEATVFCTYHIWDSKTSIKKHFNGNVTLGKPVKNMDAIIIDENQNQLPDGKKGELCLTGNQLTPGYWNDIEKNISTFFKTNVNGQEKTYYKTGDIAFFDKDSELMFVGRNDNQVKIQGFRIELGEIEYYVREFTKLTNVAAIGYQNQNGNMQIHLFLENYSENTKLISDYLNKKLPFYMIPSFISSISTFPINKNGKVDRKKLQTMINS